MNKCMYDKVNTTEDLQEEQSWKPFLKQLLVCSGVMTIYFSAGIVYGAPAIYIQQMRLEANSTDAVSVNMASWLFVCFIFLRRTWSWIVGLVNVLAASVFGYASIPWIFILTVISHVYGRRKSFLLVSFSTILMFLCFYFSVTTTHLLLTAILQGITHATSLSISILILAEYTSPKYRGIFLTMKAATVFWGIWFSNAIGTFFHWKYMPLFGFICSLYSLAAFFWPESPYWLANKGRIDECKKSHRWLKGTSHKAELELENLLNAPTQMEFGSIRDMAKKQFYKPTIIACLMSMQFYSSGKLVCSVYSIDILKNMTSSVRAAYNGMLILDGVTVFSMYIGSFLNGVLRRRLQFFSTSAVSILFLFLLSLYLYLIKLEYFLENYVLTLVLLLIFSIAISCGPAIMAPSTLGEIIPQQNKNICTIVVSIWFQILSSTTLKVFPYIYLAFGLHGAFFGYGVVMLVLTIILYKLFPETKDKTLHEIQEYFK